MYLWAAAAGAFHAISARSFVADVRSKFGVVRFIHVGIPPHLPAMFAPVGSLL